MEDEYPGLISGAKAPNKIDCRSLVNLTKHSVAEGDHPTFSRQARTLISQDSSTFRMVKSGLFSFNPMLTGHNTTVISTLNEAKALTVWNCMITLMTRKNI